MPNLKRYSHSCVLGKAYPQILIGHSQNPENNAALEQSQSLNNDDNNENDDDGDHDDDDDDDNDTINSQVGQNDHKR